MSNQLPDEDSDKYTPVTVGAKAPDFELKTNNGSVWRLSDNLGKVIALLFYPQNETLVCTRQLCSVRDNWADYVASEATVVGISPGTVEEHRDFAQKHGLPIRLLADPGRKVTEIYGSHWIFPISFMRTIVIIDAKGIVRDNRSMLRAFRPSDHKVITAIYTARADSISDKYNAARNNAREKR